MRRSELLFMPDNRPTDAFATLLSAVGIPGNDLTSANEALQKRFFQKNPVTQQPLERWELKEVEVNCPVPHIKEHLAKCGFMNKTKPSKKEYDYAAWPGALVTRAAGRLNDLIATWDERTLWKQTIAFGGKRELLADKESFEKCCEVVRVLEHRRDTYKATWEENPPKTEFEMMQWVWIRTCMSTSMRVSLIVFVDAPMKPPVKEGGPMIRPNTEDTITEWLKSDPKPGSILLSCGAPYSTAIEEAFNMLLAPRGFTIETFGHATPENLGIEVLMREVAGAVNRIYRNRIK